MDRLSDVVLVLVDGGCDAEVSVAEGGPVDGCAGIVLLPVVVFEVFDGNGRLGDVDGGTCSELPVEGDGLGLPEESVVFRMGGIDIEGGGWRTGDVDDVVECCRLTEEADETGGGLADKQDAGCTTNSSVVSNDRSSSKIMAMSVVPTAVRGGVHVAECASMSSMSSTTLTEFGSPRRSMKGGTPPVQEKVTASHGVGSGTV